MKITKIVSGGQTGADQGALEAAVWCDLPYGGWIPKGRKAEKGMKVPAKYDQLREMTTGDYLARTEANVVDSDATLVLCFGPPAGGSKKTVEFAAKHGNPCLTVDLNEPQDDSAKSILEWLKADCQDKCVLNVAGSRESKSPGIQDAVMILMINFISKANGKCFYPPAGAGKDIPRWILREAMMGDVLLLSELVDGHEPGYVVWLGSDDENIELCLAGEDDDGDICRTDKAFTIPMRCSRLLKKTGLCLA